MTLSISREALAALDAIERKGSFATAAGAAGGQRVTRLAPQPEQAN